MGQFCCKEPIDQKLDIYDKYGGHNKIVKIVDEFTKILWVHPDIRHFWDGLDTTDLKVHA